MNDPYSRIYEGWERSNWRATALDFSTDAEHWKQRLDDTQRTAATWNYSMFLVGVDTEARVLPVLLDCFAGRRAGTAFATQVADEARNRVFLDRFVREVAGVGSDSPSTLEAARTQLTWGFRGLLTELERISEALRRKPRDRPLMTQLVAVCHLIIEGVLAIPGEHFIQRYLGKEKLLPGLAKGLAHIAKDETRHVTLGLEVLKELIDSSPECRRAAISAWDRVLPWMVGVFVPPQLDRRFVECFDFTLNEIYAFGLKAFESRIRGVGIEPAELYLLSRDNLGLPYEQRAERLLTLIEAGVLGDDTREPRLTPQAFEILFEALARSTDVDVARSLGGSIEWDFTDADSWHLVVADDHVEAKPGSAGTPALRLEAASADWAKIVVGRTDARWGLLTRRLRVHGPLAAKAKLPKLFKERQGQAS